MIETQEGTDMEAMTLRETRAELERLLVIEVNGRPLVGNEPIYCAECYRRIREDELVTYEPRRDAAPLYIDNLGFQQYEAGPAYAMVTHAEHPEEAARDA
jgi:hypothetical protein